MFIILLLICIGIKYLKIFEYIFYIEIKIYYKVNMFISDILVVLGEAGVWGLEGGVIGNFRSVFFRCLEVGDFVEGVWEDRLKMSMEFIGEGGLSFFVVDILWVCLFVMVLFTYLFRKC